MNTIKITPHKTVKAATDHMFTLGDLTMRLAAVDRAPRYRNGDRENDAEHSFHLALAATELAPLYPELDAGLVTQFSLVHDLPESYVGDTWTLQISNEDRHKKEKAEKSATKKLLKELPPHTAQLLKRYEKQTEPEARFVRFVDKLLPEIINLNAGIANSFKEDHKIHSQEEMDNVQCALSTRYQNMFPEFPIINSIHQLIVKRFTDQIFGQDQE